MTLGALDVPDPYAALEKAASDLKRGAGWTGPLQSSVRYVVAGMILRQGLPVKTVHAQVRKTREALRRRKVPRGRLQATLASLLLVLDSKGKPVSARTLDRTEQILRRWNDDHPWLTGADDLPAAALHALRDDSVESVAFQVERAYQRLRELRFRRGNPLQLVSHLLAFDPRGVDEAVSRFRRIVDRFGEKRMKIRTSRYDEAAILALSNLAPAAVVDRTLAYRDRLRAAPKRPSAEIAFSLAAGLVLAEDARQATDGQRVSDLSQLRAAQAVIAAQQAAMVAAITASSAAASAAASAG